MPTYILINKKNFKNIFTFVCYVAQKHVWLYFNGLKSNINFKVTSPIPTKHLLIWGLNVRVFDRNA